MALCAALALVGHVLLLGMDASAGHVGAPHGTAVSGPMQVSVVVEAAPAMAQDAAAEIPPDAPSQDAMAATAEAGRPGLATPEPPTFAGDLPDVGFPDALLPDAGVQVRAYVDVDAEGRVQNVVTALHPADAEPAFGDYSARALANAHFEPHGAASGHCLQLDFNPGTNGPTWGWRPDATPQRCLTNPARTARPLHAP